MLLLDCYDSGLTVHIYRYNIEGQPVYYYSQAYFLSLSEDDS